MATRVAVAAFGPNSSRKRLFSIWILMISEVVSLLKFSSPTMSWTLKSRGERGAGPTRFELDDTVLDPSLIDSTRGSLASGRCVFPQWSIMAASA